MKRKGTACQGNVYSGPTAVRMLLCVAALGSPRWGSCETSNLCREHRVQSGKEDPQAGRLGRGLALAWQHIEKGTPRLGEFIRELEPLVGRPCPLCLLLIGPVRIDLGTRHSLPQRCVNNRRECAGGAESCWHIGVAGTSHLCQGSPSSIAHHLAFRTGFPPRAPNDRITDAIRIRTEARRRAARCKLPIPWQRHCRWDRHGLVREPGLLRKYARPA